MEQNTVTQRNSSQFIEGASLLAVTVGKTARTTARALIHEHPYALLFLLIFGVFLLPLSATAIIGTLFLVFATSSTIFISVVFFAPALFLLTIMALVMWIVSTLLLGSYRYVWATEQHQTDIAKHRSTRYKMFRSTLEEHEGSNTQQEIITAIANSTPKKISIRLSGDEVLNSKRIKTIPRESVSNRLDLEELVNSHPFKQATEDAPGSDFFPREEVSAPLAADAPNEAA